MWNKAKTHASDWMYPMIRSCRFLRDRSFSWTHEAHKTRLPHIGIIFPFDVHHTSSDSGSGFNINLGEITLGCISMSPYRMSGTMHGWIQVVQCMDGYKAETRKVHSCFVSIHALYHSMYFSGFWLELRLQNHLSCSSSGSEFGLSYSSFRSSMSMLIFSGGLHWRYHVTFWRRLYCAAHCQCSTRSSVCFLIIPCEACISSLHDSVSSCSVQQMLSLHNLSHTELCHGFYWKW